MILCGRDAIAFRPLHLLKIEFLKILLVTGNFLPGKNGGIENYVFWLAKLLEGKGFLVEVAALYVIEKQDYVYERIPVHFLHTSLAEFELVLKKNQFDICHFHEYSEYGGIEIPWLVKAKEYCRKVFFTFHLPYLTCYKNDFRYKGIEDCNTFNNPARCAECIIFEKAKNTIGSVLSPGAVMLSNILGVKNKLERKVSLKHTYFNQLIATCDEIFVIADWFKTLLFENGYANSKTHKIPNKPRLNIAKNELAETGVIKNRLIFIGRIQHQKGLHLLCKAMNGIDRKEWQLDVYGNKVDEKYFNECIEIFSFNYKGSIPRELLLEQMKEYDFLVLPSVFTEMYPIVIIDAFHRELPVIASTAKGNKDVVKEEVNGFLFEYDNAKDLAKTIGKAFRLKKEGWLPTFVYPENPEKDIEEIVSYYHK